MSDPSEEAVLGMEPDEPSRDEAAAAVRAELEHHLACAADALRGQGLDPEAARQEARRRFGDVEAIGRACVRIRTGGTQMWKRLHLALTIVLAVGIVFSLLLQRQATALAQRSAEEARMEAAHAMQLVREKERPAPVEHIVIGVGDAVALIDQYGHDLGEVQVVAADGKILLPGAGWVLVAERTRDQAEAMVTEALKPFYDQVDVKIRVASR